MPTRICFEFKKAPAPHGASLLVQAMSAWSVKTRCAPSRLCGDARVYGHTNTVMHDVEYSAPLGAMSAASDCTRRVGTMFIFILAAKTSITASATDLLVGWRYSFLFWCPSFNARNHMMRHGCSTIPLVLLRAHTTRRRLGRHNLHLLCRCLAPKRVNEKDNTHGWGIIFRTFYPSHLIPVNRCSKRSWC